MKELDILRALEAHYTGCRACALHASRTKLVHMRGSLRAKLFIVGEAPGADEDAQGIPFVGESGRKLDEALKLAGLDRAEDVFITNTVACRPPGNRNPSRGEIRECAGRLHRLLRLVEPRAVLLLGAVAARMMGVSSVKQWHGMVSEWEVIMTDGSGDVSSAVARTWPAVCTWHPAYVLRSGLGEPALTRVLADDIRAAWEAANAQ